MASLSRINEKVFLLILTPDENNEFQKLSSPTEKKRWLWVYWKRRDPTPTTEKNELQEEFERRVDYGCKWYRAPLEEGFDDRGKIYVKYGEPTDKFIQPGGEIDAWPNESWVYPEIAKGLTFDFVERGGYYKLVNDLNRALVSGLNLSLRLQRVAQLYENRSYLDASYGAIASELHINLSAGNVILAQSQFESSVAKNHVIRYQAPTAVLDYSHHAKALPTALSLARFRQGDSVRAEIYYGVPYDHLRFDQDNIHWQAELRGEIVIFNEEYNLVAKDSVRTVCIAPTEAAKQSGAFISQFSFVMHPGQYHLALRLENFGAHDGLDNILLGILRADFSCPRFSENKLQLSDIQLSPNIRLVERANRFVKNDLEIMPLPGMSISKQRPLHVYYEIYNLSVNSQHQTVYEIEYSVHRLDRKGGLLRLLPGLSSGKKSVALREKRIGNSPSQFERVILDLNALEAGKLELEVTVRDVITNQTARATTPLRLEQ